MGVRGISGKCSVGWIWRIDLDLSFGVFEKDYLYFISDVNFKMIIIK